MKINKATYERASEEDGSVYTVINCNLENKTESTIEMTKGYALILDSSGVVIANDSEREEDSFAESGESYSTEYSPSIDFQNHISDISKMTAIVDVTSFRREFFKIGEFECPQDPSKPLLNDFTKETGDLRIHGVYIYQQKPYEDDTGDERTIETKIYLRNISDKYIEKAKVKVQLLDKEDAIIETSEDERNIAPSASNCCNVYLSAKKGKLKGANLKVSLSVFYAVEHFHDEAPITLQKD
jgi:hypothetical protein